MPFLEIWMLLYNLFFKETSLKKIPNPRPHNWHWNFGSYQDFLVVSRWNQLRTFKGTYIQEQFYRFLRSSKPRENLWNYSRRYNKMFKTDFIFRQQKVSLHQNVWCDPATMQQNAFLGDITVLKSGWNMKQIFCCPALMLFHCLSQLFGCLSMWTTVKLHGKKLQNATKHYYFMRFQF